MFSGNTALTEAVAKGYHKLLAYKDEYEVARLYAAPKFKASLAAQFEDPKRLEFHLAPPLLAQRDPHTGQMIKKTYGPWMLTAFSILQHFRFLRGTRLDIFGRTEERHMERALITEYEATVEEILAHLSPATLSTAVSLAALPDKIRGYGHVKERNARTAATERTRLLEKLHGTAPQQALAAE
jgi:indolepyruvate ferredoxin oxidoreductase